VEGRTVSMLLRGGEDTITKMERPPTLVFGYIILLDESGYKLFQLKQQFYGLSAPLDNRRTSGLVSTIQSSNELEPTFES
jgi:hypothetical protein